MDLERSHTQLGLLMGFGIAGLLLAAGIFAALFGGAPTSAAPPAPAPSSLAEALEIGRDDLAQLPRGKEADGIAGDFVIRNSWIEALVSGNLPGRRANMTTNYAQPTCGCL